MKTLVLSLVVTGLFAAPAQAVTVYSWENSLENWAEGGSSVEGYSTTVGVTDGTYSLMLDPTANNYPLARNNWQAGADFANFNAAQKANTTLLIDITTTAQSTSGGEVYNFFYAFFDSSYQSLGFSGNMTLIPDGVTRTYAFDYSAAGFGGPSIDWGMFRIGVNDSGFTPETLYLDNLRFIPEPASLALLGVGALIFGRRRRA